MARWATKWAMAGALALAVAGGAGVPRAGEEPPPVTIEQSAAAMNALGARLLSLTLSEEETAERMVSPLSLGTALLMVAQGAAGETAEALAAGFGIEPAGLPALGAAGGRLLRALQEEGAGEAFSAANALWVAPDLGLREAFAERQREDFEAAVAPLDFAETSALEQVNAWFAEATRGMIAPMLEELPPDTRLLLANALHFKSDWQVTFDPAETAEGDFRRLDGTTAGAAFMARAGKLRYREGEGLQEGLQAVSLAFAGGDFEMLLLLPPAGEDPRAWGAALAPEDWAGLLDATAYAPRSGRLLLPRVVLRSGGSLRDQLAALGLAVAFGPGADFSALAEEPLMLDQVVQRTALEWDETGAEAAAATAITTTRTAVPEDEPFELVLDRPFFAVLRHAGSGAVLLQGLVADPGDKES